MGVGVCVCVCGGAIWGMCLSSGVGVFYSMSRSGSYQFESVYHKGESIIIGYVCGWRWRLGVCGGMPRSV